MKSLGILIGKTSNDQWNKNIEKVRKAFYIWRGRNISITGKAKLANAKLLSPFWYLIHTQPLPKKAVIQINRICATFIWSSNFEPIRRTTLYNSLENGSAGLLEVSLKTLVQRIKVINNLHKYSIWTSLAKAFLQPHIPNIIITTEKINRIKPPTILLEMVRCYKTMKENFSDEIIFTSTPKELYNKVIDKLISKPQNRIHRINMKSKSIIKIVSKLNIPGKAKTIFWKLHHNCLQTNEWRKQKKLTKCTDCPICYNKETLQHAILECKHTNLLWATLSNKCSLTRTHNIEDIKWSCEYTETKHQLIILIIAVNAIWTSRNLSYYKKTNELITLSIFKNLMENQQLLEYKNQNFTNIEKENWIETGLIIERNGSQQLNL
ncbi:uncharacterized protein [Centruroides vittatus]|uniref:uncharacterized protein n=1 Tax=Centruroides vittatus TaxID=120091 RepID=UPI00350EAD2B